MFKMRTLVYVRKFFRFFNKKFNFCKSKDVRTRIEEYVYQCTKNVLEFTDTDINVDEYGKRYCVENDHCHFTLKILGNSDAVLMTNTHDNVEKKLSTKLVSEIIDLILKEKNKRMEEKFIKMEQREIAMCERIHDLIKNEKERRSKLNKI